MCELLTLLMTSTGFQGASANAQQFEKKGPVFVACWVYMRRNSTSPVMWGLMIIYFINHNLRIPSLNNQDSMESKKDAKRFFHCSIGEQKISVKASTSSEWKIAPAPGKRSHTVASCYIPCSIRSIHLHSGSIFQPAMLVCRSMISFREISLLLMWLYFLCRAFCVWGPFSFLHDAWSLSGGCHFDLCRSKR